MLNVVYAQCLKYALYAVRNYAECHYAECRYAECHYAECHNAECCFAECCYAECRIAEFRGVLGNIWFFYILCCKYFVNLHQQQTHFSSPSLGDIETCTKTLKPSIK
jgi:hypothetical protein